MTPLIAWQNDFGAIAFGPSKSEPIGKFFGHDKATFITALNMVQEVNAARLIASVNGNVTVRDQIVTLPDGSQIDLRRGSEVQS